MAAFVGMFSADGDFDRVAVFEGARLAIGRCDTVDVFGAGIDDIIAPEEVLNGRVAQRHVAVLGPRHARKCRLPVRGANSPPAAFFQIEKPSSPERSSDCSEAISMPMSTASVPATIVT